MSASLYRQVLGEAFERLPPAVQRLHDHTESVSYVGVVDVRGPENFLGKILARLLGTPMQSGHGPITFDLKISLATERWTRRFATNVMSSTFSTANGLLIEKLGAATLHFKLEATKDMLEMKIVSMSFLGIPSPKWLLPRIVGEET
jgi:Domain of unknown function (DUF4166)